MKFFQKLFATPSRRFEKKLQSIVEATQGFEKDLKLLTLEGLGKKTFLFKQRLHQGESLDKLLPEAFAVVREVARRVLGQRHFDEQVRGGAALHFGMVAEMKTGEGKTLSATLPVYLNALCGKGVHVITINDYLAQRDAKLMGKVYEALGLRVGVISSGLRDDKRQEAYRADITYGTNSEFGFDYLRDNMKFYQEEMCQRPFFYAIVDEVDSILIDEARTPLIISGAPEDSSDLYRHIDKVVRKLTCDDFEKDEKNKTVVLTEKGVETIETLLREANLLSSATVYDVQNVNLVHHVNQALRAQQLFFKEKDYIVNEGKVIIIDEFTGRMMEGRRYSEGLHQALEAKEGVEIQMENQTLGSITFQNYFRLYPKISGMTGTALTEAAEFQDIYGLRVWEIPTHKPLVRKDLNDEIYCTFQEKLEAMAAFIEKRHQEKQPILIGTTSIEKSELVSRLLKKRGIAHQVLNARHHEKEASIIAQAGAPGAVTVATNMAGRGTDIQLGGNLSFALEKALEKEKDPSKHQEIAQHIERTIKEKERIARQAGGLLIVGTERHESRRIDNQLRGRSGRQGDPGMSQFFLSLEDDLMRIFGSDRLDKWLKKFGLQQGEPIKHPWIDKALERAQEKVEARNYDVRKHLLKYDDVINEQRKEIYQQRLEYIQKKDVSCEVESFLHKVVEKLQEKYFPSSLSMGQWNTDGLLEECVRLFSFSPGVKKWCEQPLSSQDLFDRVVGAVEEHLEAKEKIYTKPVVALAQKTILLRLLDQRWKEHLQALDDIRQGVYLRAYGQKDPLNEYKHESFSLFQGMLDHFQEEVVIFASHLNLSSEEPEDNWHTLEESLHRSTSSDLLYANKDGLEGLSHNPPPHLVEEGHQTQKMIGRNAPCPCGSNKRFKNCHGRI